MATPDLRSLYDLYRQIYGSQSGPPSPAQSETQATPNYPQRGYTQQQDAPKTSGAYAPVGAVLGGFPSQIGGPRWGQISAFPGPVPIGWRGPTSLGGLSPFGIPLPPGPDSIIEIPKPKFPEIRIPEVTGNPAFDASIAPLLYSFSLQAPMWRRTLDHGGPNGSTDRSGGLPSSSEPPLQQPPNGSGAPSAGILGMLLEAARRLQSTPTDSRQRSSAQADSDVRLLRRVPSTTAPTPPDTGPILFDPSAQARKTKKAQGNGSPTSPFGGMSPSGRKSGAGGNGAGNNGGGGSGSDDDDFCTKRLYEEQDECSRRWEDGEFAHKDHYWGCRKRASERWDHCNRNGGRPSPSEPRKWTLDPDEEIWINPDR